jgi:hypothetical protein
MRTALPRKTAVQGPSFAMASIGLGGANVVATTVELVGRHSARQSGRLIIDFTTVAPRLMKWSTLSVEGLNKSAIARVKWVTWNTVHRWLERAAVCCRRFSDRTIRRHSAAELQADEIKTIVGGKEQPIWVFAVIDVWSRLWPSTVVGSRSHHNTRTLFRTLPAE